MGSTLTAAPALKSPGGKTKSDESPNELTGDDCYGPALIPDCCSKVSNPKDLCLECLHILLNFHWPVCDLIESGTVKSHHLDT